MFREQEAGWGGFSPGHGPRIRAFGDPARGLRWWQAFAERGGPGGRRGFPGGPGPGRPGPGGPFRGGPFGPDPAGPLRGRLFGRGPQAERGSIRAALLALLTEGPMHGYQMIRELSARTGGAWQPSPGSVYPTLQLLEDEGLVRVEQQDERRVYHLTDAGRTAAEQRTGPPPWEAAAAASGDEGHDLRALAMGVAAAFMQVMQSGTAAQRTQARTVLTDARRALYRILAEDAPETAGTPAEGGTSETL